MIGVMIGVLWLIGAMVNACAADENFKRGDYAYGAMCCAISAVCVWQWASGLA